MQPVDTPFGEQIDVEVRAENSNGNLVHYDTASVYITLHHNPVGASLTILGPPFSTMMVNGVVRWSLTIDKPYSGYTLRARALLPEPGSFGPTEVLVTSQPFNYR